MGFTVNFDNHHNVARIKICDVMPYDILTSKLDTVKSLGAQFKP